MKSWAKRQVFGQGEQPRTVWSGVAAGGRFLIDPASKSQRIAGLDEREVGPGFRRLVATAKTFVDVGASDGYYSVTALRLNPNLTAIACDPVTELERKARENYQLNFPNGGPAWEWVSQLVGNGEDQVSLDQLTAGRPDPVFVKVDVDGFEVDVLQSGAKVLARLTTVALIEVHSAELETGTIRLLEGYGMRCQIIKNAWWRLFVPEQRPIALNRWVIAEHSRG